MLLVNVSGGGENLLALVIIEYQITVHIFVVFARLCGAALRPVRDSYFAAGARESLHFKLIDANRFGELVILSRYRKDAAMIVVQDHHGGHIWCGKHHIRRSVQQLYIEMFVLFEDIVVDDLNTKALLVDAWRKDQCALLEHIIAASFGASILHGPSAQCIEFSVRGDVSKYKYTHRM